MLVGNQECAATTPPSEMSAIWIRLTAGSSVTRLCDVGSSDMVTSVGWIERGSTLAVGTVSGQVELWDAERYG